MLLVSLPCSDIVGWAFNYKKNITFGCCCFVMAHGSWLTSCSHNRIPQHGQSLICVYPASSKSIFWSNSAMLFLNSRAPLCYVYLPLSLSPRRLIPIPVQSRTSQHYLGKAKFTLSQQQSAQGKKT